MSQRRESKARRLIELSANWTKARKRSVQRGIEEEYRILLDDYIDELLFERERRD